MAKIPVFIEMENHIDEKFLIMFFHAGSGPRVLLPYPSCWLPRTAPSDALPLAVACSAESILILNDTVGCYDRWKVSHGASSAY